jgi:ABC-type nickel/cobalt efflux system permease component RcnA
VVDLAEIPTFQEMQEVGIRPESEHPGLGAYLVRKAEALREGLRLELDGQPLRLVHHASDILFPPGAAGLPTLKLGLAFRAEFEEDHSHGLHQLHYHDRNFPGRAGWKEVVAMPEAGIAFVSSSVPQQDRSLELTDYPTDLLNSPPQEIEARITFGRVASAQGVGGVGSPGLPPSTIEAIPLQANRQGSPRSSFTELMAVNQLGLGMVLIAVAVAAGLGAFHALEPGHGKTVVAAYLVGSRGTAWHAFLLGCIVTGSHTAGVYLLGGVALYASRYVVPEQLYPWLGIVSGLAVAGLGFSLLLRRYASPVPPHTHPHSHPHPHPHLHTSDAHPSESGHPHGHRHPHERQHAVVSLRELVVLGVTGGIVPCPAALVVLLSALSLHRLAFGLLLIVAFSLGLAVVLIAIGLLMVYARRFMSRFQGEGRLVTRWLPLTSAAVITLFGIAIAVQSLATAGVLGVRL